ncbi:MAG TPA: glutaredoxin 3 [Woeseiaceae bacterium]|nr:glutaredoxin 3 [Woeseiaceae bacterium]
MMPVTGTPQHATVRMYATGWCPYCVAARDLLRAKGVSVDEIDLTSEPSRRAEMESLSGRSSVPQIFVDGEHIGGYDDLAALERSGRLDQLLGITERND